MCGRDCSFFRRSGSEGGVGLAHADYQKSLCTDVTRSRDADVAGSGRTASHAERGRCGSIRVSYARHTQDVVADKLRAPTCRGRRRGRSRRTARAWRMRGPIVRVAVYAAGLTPPNSACFSLHQLTDFHDRAGRGDTGWVADDRREALCAVRFRRFDRVLSRVPDHARPSPSAPCLDEAHGQAASRPR